MPNREPDRTAVHQTRLMDYTSIDWNNVALIVIDAQNDFIDGAMPVAGTTEILPTITELLDIFRTAGRPIVHAIRIYEPGSSDADPIRRADIEGGLQVVAPNSHGAQIPVQLTQGREVPLDAAALLRGDLQQLTADEVIMYKPRWSAFYRTQLLDWLTNRGVTSVLVAGCNLPNCPRGTLFDATERDLRAAVATDAVSQATPDRLADLTLIGVQHVGTHDVSEHLR